MLIFFRDLLHVRTFSFCISLKSYKIIVALGAIEEGRVELQYKTHFINLDFFNHIFLILVFFGGGIFFRGFSLGRVVIISYNFSQDL